jgi:hypothetical protein
LGKISEIFGPLEFSGPYPFGLKVANPAKFSNHTQWRSDGHGVEEFDGYVEEKFGGYGRLC